MMDDVLSIHVSDLHYSHKPPSARDESDWYGAMDRQFSQVRELQKDCDCEVVVAGDVFDDAWRMSRCPPELINFALSTLPNRCYATVGQHDLPNHRLEDLRKSAFCTLMKSGKVRYLAPRYPVEIDAKGTILRLHGFPWGTEVIPRTKDGTGALALDVAVIHAYIWKEGCGHVGAKPEDMSKNWRKRLGGYDVAHFGDNHTTIHTCKDGLTLFNPGGFFRRRIDEVDHRPCVGLLRRDGTVDKHYLDVSQDKFLNKKDIPLIPSDLVDFESVAELLSALTDSATDLEAAIRWAVDKIDPSSMVRQMIISCLDKTRKK